MLKILHCGIFNDHIFGGDIILKKGFLLNGCQVEGFDYREFTANNSQKLLQKELIKKSKGSDILFIGKGELIEPDTLKTIKKNGTTTALWYGDIRPTPEKWLINLLHEVDFYFMTSSGEMLKTYHKLGKPKHSSFFFNPCDPDIVDLYSQKLSKKYDVLFTGSYYNFADDERYEVVKALCRRKDTLIIGGSQKICQQSLLKKSKDRILKRHSNKYIRGERYINFIKQSKIGIGVSAKNNIRYYSSDRFTHYISLGTFFLPKYFPGIEDFFDLNTEIDTFKTIEEMNKKIDYYLINDEEREEKAKKAQQKIIDAHNTKKTTNNFIKYLYNT